MQYSLVTALTSVGLAVVAAFQGPIQSFVADHPALASLLGACVTLLAAIQHSFLKPAPSEEPKSDA